MLADQITPHLPKDNKEVNVHMKSLQAQLDAATVQIQSMTRRTETGVMMMTTSRVLIGTRPAASLNKRSAAEDATETTMVEMHMAKLKTDAEIRSVKSKNSAMKGTMIIMVLAMTNLTRSIHQKGDTS
jgi:hypothetical protein